ncbi:MAG TPA: flagellar basal body protein [Telluria sp.]|nr:flagellar basal body protein [Telluria sp.]
MVSLIDGNTTALLSLALDAAGMRQQAIAQNIANVNTPAYQRMSVNFEVQLAAVRDSAGAALPSLADLSNYRPAFAYADSADDGIALDMEVADLSENTLHQHALLKALTKHLGMISLAINEGKR